MLETPCLFAVITRKGLEPPRSCSRLASQATSQFRSPYGRMPFVTATCASHHLISNDNWLKSLESGEPVDGREGLRSPWGWSSEKDQAGE